MMPMQRSSRLQKSPFWEPIRVRARLHSLLKNSCGERFCNRARLQSCRNPFKLIRRALAPAALPFAIALLVLFLGSQYAPAQQHFDGAKALEYTRQFVAIGPERVAGTSGLRPATA